MTSVRKQIEELFTEEFADIEELAGLRVIATERDVDLGNQSVALLRVQSIARTPEAPMSHRTVGMLLTLISRHEDLDRAADELDELVPAALDFLDPLFKHGEATSVQYSNRLAYDIPIEVLAQKEA